jgi:peptidyl-prolyl cis-trans isomerase SurA
LIQRIESHVGLRQILVAERGEAGRERAADLLRRLRAGADFGELAELHSGEPISRTHQGFYALFERGPDDASVKRATFELVLDELADPLESPLGWHLVQRVDPRRVPSELAEKTFIRLRALLIAHTDSAGPSRFEGRQEPAARELADALHQRILAGEDMADLAQQWNDDPGGRERRGDLGWVHRGTPGLPTWIRSLWTRPVGWLTPPITTPAGFVILRRES